MEGAVWVEFIKTYPQVQYMLLPRILALAEVTWSAKKDRQWDGFLKRLPYQFKLFAKEKWNFDEKNTTFEENK